MSEPILSVMKPLAPSSVTVEDPDELAYYSARLVGAMGAPPTWSKTRFPGCNPRGLGRADMRDRVRGKTFMVAHKSDGVRYALFLTIRRGSTAEDPKAVAFMVDRAMHFYEVQVLAPEAHFVQESVFEGELVWQMPEGTRQLFLVFDCLRCGGVRYATLPFARRIEEVRRCTRWSEETMDCSEQEQVERVCETDGVVLLHIAMRPKTFVGAHFAVALWKDRGEAEHRVDGLILQDACAAYKHGTAHDGSVFKWKSHVTVDLRGSSAATLDGPIPHEVHGRRLRLSTESRIVARSEDDIIEYHMQVGEETIDLFAIRSRTDKTHANPLHVVERSVADVLDAVEVEEIAA